MTPRDLVDLAIENGVFLYVHDDCLSYRARPGALSTELREALARHSSQIVAHLKRIESSDRVDPALALPPVSRRAPAGPAPLSYAQHRLWYIDQLEGDRAGYRMERAYRLTGPLDVAALVRAFEVLVARHEALRTIIVEADGAPHQVVRDAATIDVHRTDLSALPPSEQEAEVARLRLESRLRPFDLARDVLLRASVVTLSPASHVLLLSMHHIATDAWSQRILQRELEALYAAYTSGSPDPLPPLPLQYADYAAWQRHWLDGDALARHLDFWRAALAGIPAVHALPLDDERPARPAHRGATHRLDVTSGTHTGIRALCHRYDVTPFMFLHAALSVLLARYSDETDIVIGTPVSGRVHPDFDPIVGLFVNTLVLRSRLDGDPSFEQLLARTKAYVLSALAHQHLPFELLVEEINPARTLSHNPVFQVLLNMPPGGHRPLSLENVTAEFIGGGEPTTKFDLVFTVRESAGGLTIVFDYSAEIFRSSTIERMARNFGTLLESIVAAPAERIWHLTLLSPDERDRLVHRSTAFSGSTAYVLDSHGEQTPEGAWGELCVPAESDTSGEAPAPLPADVSARPRFVAAPAGTAAGCRLRRTGDRVRWLPDATLQSGGRVADRSTIGGVRVNLADVRKVLSAVHWIAAYALARRLDAAGRELLAVYVTPADGERVLESAVSGLVERIAPALSPPQVPFGIAEVNRIPVTAEGAVLVDRLPVPECIVPRAAAATAATETEQRMQRVWRTILGDRPLGIDGSFFAAGGHSLSAIALIRRIAGEFGVDIPLPTFIAAPTIRDTSMFVDRAVSDRACGSGVS